VGEFRCALADAQSVKAMRFAEYRKAIKFKIRFKAVAEEVQPTILCRICELFAVLRALMLESELVLEVMHHFVHQDGLVCGRSSGPAFDQVDYFRAIDVDRNGIVRWEVRRRLGLCQSGVSRDLVGRRRHRAVVTQSADLAGRDQFDFWESIDDR
jgi:hypothetical protein